MRNGLKITAVAALVLLGVTFLLSRAHHRRSDSDTVKAFYFWKVRWAPTANELQSLNDLQINRLYLRFFDIGWDPSKNYPEPVAPIQFGAPVPAKTSIVPVVYIRNQVFQNLPYESLPKFAAQVWSKVTGMAGENKIQFKQVQVDCDWSDSTRAIYFRFLELMKEEAHKTHVALSATIRLHQIKYSARTGVPPVDRGMLMFYNMGKLESESERSSIYNSADARRYTAALKDYKMELDVVLPIFSWLVQSRSGHIRGLVEKMDLAELTDDRFAQVNAHTYVAKRSVFIHGNFIKKGDQIAVEEISPAVTREAADLVARSLGRGQHPGAVAFFDFDERNLKKYETADLSRVFSSFN